MHKLSWNTLYNVKLENFHDTLIDMAARIFTDISNNAMFEATFNET